MRPQKNIGARSQKASRNLEGDGPNWVLIVGGALLSTLSIRIGYKLKQKLGSSPEIDKTVPKSGGKSSERRVETRHSNSNPYAFGPDDDNCFNCTSETEGIVEMKNPRSGPILTEHEAQLSLVTVPVPEYPNRENGMVWVSSPDRTELPQKPLHFYSNCSDSPCASDSGSDVFTKREVIQKLRQQLKRRDEMILEMQDQIAELQNAVSTQMGHASLLQSQLDAANKELFESEREIQRLRKAIADHCWGHVAAGGYHEMSKVKGTNGQNGHMNRHVVDGESKFDTVLVNNKGKGDGEKVDMLKKEIEDLKEVIHGKEFLLQSYKEQKSELSIKIRELQYKLDSQLPNIL